MGRSEKTARCKACWNWPDLPYVGAGVLASAVSMDKEVTKRLCAERGLPVAEFMVVTRGDYDLDDICARSAVPDVRQAGEPGSSVGISKAKTCEELERRAEVRRGIRPQNPGGARHRRGANSNAPCWAIDDPVAAVPCEILPSREFYDYEDKYMLDTSETVLPGRSDAGADARNAASGGRVLPGGALRGHGARRLSARDAPPANSL